MSTPSEKRSFAPSWRPSRELPAVQPAVAIGRVHWSLLSSSFRERSEIESRQLLHPFQVGDDRCRLTSVDLPALRAPG